MDTTSSSDKSQRPDKRMRRRLLTVYGRNAALEALQDRQLTCQTLHLADSNKPKGVIRDLLHLAEGQGLAVRYHSREALARISRNGKQDQGVALDVFCASMLGLDDYMEDLQASAQQTLIAFDGVTNPQNMGMAIRSATAAGVDGILYADQGNPALGPLVIKASAGTVFKAPLLRCASIKEGVTALLNAGFALYRLQADSSGDLYETVIDRPAVFVLGGESDGISAALSAMPGKNLAIPMANSVESLNVAVSAALVAYAVRQRPASR